MAISYAPKLKKLINANKDEAYLDSFRSFLRAFDQLIHQSVKEVNQVNPPPTPANGDAYHIQAGSSPTGAWAGQDGKIAVWTTDASLPNSNTPDPQWEFYQPNVGDQFYCSNNNQFHYEVDVNFTIFAVTPYWQGALSGVTGQTNRSLLGSAGMDYLELNEDGLTIYGNVTGYGSIQHNALACGANEGLYIETFGGSGVDQFGIFSNVISEYWNTFQDGTKTIDFLGQNWNSPWHSQHGLIGNRYKSIAVFSGIDVMPNNTSYNQAPNVSFNGGGVVAVTEVLCTAMSSEHVPIVFGCTIGQVGSSLVHDGVKIKLAGGVDYVFSTIDSRICLELRGGNALELWRNNL